MPQPHERWQKEPPRCPDCGRVKLRKRDCYECPVCDTADLYTASQLSNGAKSIMALRPGEEYLSK